MSEKLLILKKKYFTHMGKQKDGSKVFRSDEKIISKIFKIK